MKCKLSGCLKPEGTDVQKPGGVAGPAEQATRCCGGMTLRTGVFLTGLALGMLGTFFGAGCTVGAWSESVTDHETATDSSLTGPSAHEEAAAAGGAQGAALTRPEPVWQETLQQAVAHAAASDLPVLLRFSATWCSPCRVMDATTWPDEQVKTTLAKHAVPVKIDIDDEKNAAVVQRYGIRTIPAVLLIDANGDELARGGFMGPDALIDFLNRP